MPVKFVASSLQDTPIRGSEGSPTQVIDLQFNAKTSPFYCFQPRLHQSVESHQLG